MKKPGKYLYLLLVFFLLSAGISSCNNKELQPGEARIRGRVVNPAGSIAILKRADDPGALRNSIKLGANGEFEHSFFPDSAGSFTFIYGGMYDNNASPSGNGKEPMKLDLIIDRGYDLKIWIDTKNPGQSLSVSGKGGELNNYIASKGITEDEFEDTLEAVISAPANEFLSALNKYKLNLDALIAKLPPSSPDIPADFREEEAKKNYYDINRRKIQYVIRNMFTENAKTFPEELFSFMSELPLDKPDAVNDPGSLLLISAYSEYLALKNYPEISADEEKLSAAKYESLKSIFRERGGYDAALFGYLKSYVKSHGSEWWKNAYSEFISGPAPDSLKRELSRLKNNAVADSE